MCSNRDSGIGVCFTDEAWCRWLLERAGALDVWLSGGRVCDPTAGEGAFALALCGMAVERGAALTDALLERLSLIEIEPRFLDAFRRKFRRRFVRGYPESSLHCQDVITSPHQGQYDILVGNPPWANFTDLPEEYKEKLKPWFIRENLTPSGEKLLLGGSRVDVAALVLNSVLGRLLVSGGRAAFFLPLSLFFGDSAHDGFRRFMSHGRRFRVTSLYEFDASLQVFPGIGTSYGAALFQMDEPQAYPVPLHRMDKEGETLEQASPLSAESSWVVGGPLRISLPRPLPEEQRPRQGVNTCGGKEVFIFQGKPEFLEPELLYPLADRHLFRGEEAPRRWILIPHDRVTGRALEWEELPPHVQEYLASHRSLLEGRRGSMLQGMIRHSRWWALLGVGRYSFAPWKVMWEACGARSFAPRVVGAFAGQPWQGNQAMHAFIPCTDFQEAQELCRILKESNLTDILSRMRSGGKSNWAQPGKIWSILHS